MDYYISGLNCKRITTLRLNCIYFIHLPFNQFRFLK